MIVSGCRYTQQDDISNEKLPLNTEAVKERRVESNVDVNFQFRFNNNRFSFSLPTTTSKKIIRAIENTYDGEAFGFLDIPIVIRQTEMSYRRIFRTQLRLPEWIKRTLQ